MSQDTQNRILDELARYEHERLSRKAKSVWEQRREHLMNATQEEAYGYVRAANDLSRTIQAQALQQFAQTHGYNILETFTDDCYAMLDPLHRPGFQSLVKVVEEGSASVVLVMDPSRIVRQQSSLKKLQERIAIFYTN